MLGVALSLSEPSGLGDYDYREPDRYAVSSLYSLLNSLYHDLSERTPVDTGAARLSWRYSEVEIDTSVSDGIYPAEGRYVGAASPPFYPAAVSIDVWPDGWRDNVGTIVANTHYITNNQPHIVALEHGHSTQAPAGMLQIATDNLVDAYNVIGDNISNAMLHVNTPYWGTVTSPFGDYEAEIWRYVDWPLNITVIEPWYPE